MSQETYPLAGFRFKVEFGGIQKLADMRFQEVNGLKAEVETEQLREGGMGSFAYNLPKRVKYPNLELKRAMMPESRVHAWVRDALENFNFRPLLVTVSLLGETGEPLLVWEAHQAWPVSWALSGLHAETGGVLMETLTLAYACLRFLR